MTHDEIIKALFDETLVGNAPAVLELTNQGIAGGMTPSTILFDALIPALEEVGARFEEISSYRRCSFQVRRCRGL